MQLRNDLEGIIEEISKAKRLHELVVLQAPEDAVILNLAERSVGSIIQQAEPFATLVPLNSALEVEVDVQARDIARIRTGDSVRVKLDVLPFQKHDTLPGEVRVISEEAFAGDIGRSVREQIPQPEASGGFYRARVRLLSTTLRNVPDGFRLMPGMKVRAEIKVGTRTVISYFLHPVSGFSTRACGSHNYSFLQHLIRWLCNITIHSSPRPVASGYELLSPPTL